MLFCLFVLLVVLLILFACLFRLLFLCFVFCGGRRWIVVFLLVYFACFFCFALYFFLGEGIHNCFFSCLFLLGVFWLVCLGGNEYLFSFACSGVGGWVNRLIFLFICFS